MSTRSAVFSGLVSGLLLAGMVGASAVAAESPAPAATDSAAPWRVANHQRLVYDIALQHADGSWSDDHPAGIAGMGNEGVCTSLGELCLLGAGYDQITPNRYRAQVAKGLNWILVRQQADGSFPGSLIANALQTITICEGFALTNDPNLRGPVQNAVAALLARRVAIPGSPTARAWPNADGSISTRANLFCILALKSAAGASMLDDGQALTAARAWLAITGKLPAFKTGSGHDSGGGAFPATVNFAKTPVQLTGSDPVAALAAAAFMGLKRGDSLVDSLLAQTKADTRASSASRGVDHDYLLLRSYALFQCGSAQDFANWETIASRDLELSQITSGPRQGSWPAPMLINEPELGSTSSTLLAQMTYAIFYRWHLLTAH